MAVGFTVKFYWYQAGSGDFLHSEMEDVEQIRNQIPQ